MYEEKIGYIMFGIVLGMIFVFAAFWFDYNDSVIISKETAKEICINITNNTEVKVITSFSSEKLVCILPDDGVNKNIIIKNEKEVNAK